MSKFFRIKITIVFTILSGIYCSTSFAQYCENDNSDVLTYGGQSELSANVPPNQRLLVEVPNSHAKIYIENLGDSNFSLQADNQVIYEGSENTVDETQTIYRIERRVMNGAMGARAYPEGRNLEYGDIYYVFHGYSRTPTHESCKSRTSIIGTGLVAMEMAVTGRPAPNTLPQTEDCTGFRSRPVHPETNTHTFFVKEHNDVKIKVVCGQDCAPRYGTLTLANLFSKDGKIKGIAGTVLWAHRPFKLSCSEAYSTLEPIEVAY